MRVGVRERRRCSARYRASSLLIDSERCALVLQSAADTSSPRFTELCFAFEESSYQYSSQVILLSVHPERVQDLRSLSLCGCARAGA